MNIAICDDNPGCRKQLKEMLAPYNLQNNLNCIEFDSGEALLSSVLEHNWDIVFMDIEMEGISGIEAGKQLRKIQKDVIIIFVTSYVNYVSEAFRQNAFQFLVKPIDETEFRKDFERAMRLWRNRHRQYILKTTERTYSIKYSEILFVEAYHRHIKIHTVKEDYETMGKLNDEYQKLKLYGFTQCHQGYIVNMALINSISKIDVEMKDGSRVPVSRRLYITVMKDFNLYMAGKTV